MSHLNLLQDSKRFDKELGECQKFLSEVRNAALRRFILMGIPAKIEAQVSAFCLKGAQNSLMRRTRTGRIFLLSMTTRS